MRLICIIAFASSLWPILADEVTLTRSIKADSVYLKLIGTLDPRLHDLYFISALQSRFEKYCKLHVANLIYGFDLSVMFMNEQTHYDYGGQDGVITITSWCEIQTTFSLPLGSDPILFSSNNASLLVMNFCSSSEIDQLIEELDEMDNITVSSIASFPAGSKEVQLLLKNQSIPSTNTSSDSEDSKSLVALAFVSLAIVFFAITALALSSLRRRCSIGKVEYDNSSNFPQPTSAEGEHNRPAICHDAGCENDSLASTSNQTNHNDLESFMVVSTCETSVIGSEIDKYESGVGDDPSGRQESSETFDDEESASSRTDAYPDYQCNSSLPSNSASPAWSMDSFSQNTSPYSANAEGLSKRRRWHDEVNDLNILSLPESFSSIASTNHSSTSSNDARKR
jgi:hypothetical protein